MQCPFCSQLNSDKVIDSRLTEGGVAIRRRRECTACGKRYTTKERVDDEPRMFVCKKDGSRVPFDRRKILTGLERACYKRPVSAEQLNRLVVEVEEQLFSQFDREIPAQAIGECVSQRLRKLDNVAYVRFASVYHEFQELDDFVHEVNGLKQRQQEDTNGQQKLFSE